MDQPEDNEDFAEFSRSFFCDFLMGDDAASWNSLFVNPESVGYERPEDYVPGFAYYYDDDDSGEVIDYLDEATEELAKYDYDSLNRNQQYEYRIIQLYTGLYYELYADDADWAILAYISFISPYGGSVADAVSTLENYKFRTVSDFEDLISYILSAEECFPTYIQYGEDRIERGFELPDTTIDSMIEFLDGIVSEGTDYYLYAYLEKQVNAVDFLTESEKTVYIERIKAALTDSFLPACKALEDALPSLKGHWEGGTSTSIAHYGEKAKGYLVYKLQVTLGTLDVDIDEYGSELLSYYNSSVSEYNAVIKRIQAKGTNFVNKLVDDIGSSASFLGCTTDEELVELCKKYASSIVYPLPFEPDISIKYTDESIGEYASYIAYYVTSPLDTAESPTEYITLNPTQLSCLADTVTYLAHEGYPGHLYSHVYEKEKGHSCYIIMESLSGSEAWAQYAAYTLLNTIARSVNNSYYQLECQYLASSLKVNYLYSNYIEYLCNYLGYDVNDLMKELETDEEDALGIIDFCESNVAGLVGYGYAFAKMCSVHTSVKTSTEGFNEADFNRYILNNYGLESISRYEELAKKYVQP